MIVDLLRNDLGRVCLPGTIRVPELFTVEKYPNVHQLVSSVTGRLRPEHDAVDLLKACFPGGSVTGAPKIRAMEIIDEIEPVQRGVYCGAIGYIGFDGSMQLSIPYTHDGSEGTTGLLAGRWRHRCRLRSRGRVPRDARQGAWRTGGAGHLRFANATAWSIIVRRNRHKEID